MSSVAPRLAVTLFPAVLAITITTPHTATAATLHADALVPGQIVISEVMPDPSKVGDTAGEWFEVLNPLAAPVDLEGLVFESQKGSGVEKFTVSGSHVVDPGGLFVFGNTADPSRNGGYIPDYTYGGALSFGNASDFVRIRKADGTTLVQVAWTSTQSGVSLEVRAGILPTITQAGLGLPAGDMVYGLGDIGTPGFANSMPVSVGPIVPAPVPEPGTWMLLAGGLGLLTLSRRRLRRCRC